MRRQREHEKAHMYEVEVMLPFLGDRLFHVCYVQGDIGGQGSTELGGGNVESDELRRRWYFFGEVGQVGACTAGYVGDFGVGFGEVGGDGWMDLVA